MQENINIVELEKSLQNIKELTEKMTRTLVNVNSIIKENVNSGIGIWDSQTADVYRTRWESLMEEFPGIVLIFNQQASNLEQLINNMKKVEEW